MRMRIPVNTGGVIQLVGRLSFLTAVASARPEILWEAFVRRLAAYQEKCLTSQGTSARTVSC
jgi:hypothetical protein